MLKRKQSNTRGNASKFGPENALKDNKNTYWATDDHFNKASLPINLKKPTLFNRFLVQETGFEHSL